MLQPAVISKADCALASANVPAPTVWTTTTDDPPLTMLQSLNQKNLGTEASSEQCPTCLGNPASILPFLTAQANSVFSMASGNEGSFPSVGSILTSSTQALTCDGNNAKDSESDLPAGLDLGNGWKVVGLTSLTSSADLPMQTSVPAPRSQNISVNPFTSGSVTPDASRLVATDAGTSSLNKTGSVVDTQTLLSSSVSGEWKVVGLTSLNPSTPGITCNSKAAAIPVQSLESSDGVSLSASVTESVINDSILKQNEKSKESDLASKLGSDLHLPSLADLAAGTSEWKIAGITTLVGPVGPSTACSSDKQPPTCVDTGSPLACPVAAPDNTATEPTEWKVVGVTSLDSTPLNSPPVVASSVTPIPVVMASPSPLVTMPIPLAAAAAAKDAEWKVVGMVPLQNKEETLPKSAESSAVIEHQTCSTTPESPVPGQINFQESVSQAQTSQSTKESPDEASVQNSWTPSRLTQSRKWASRFLARREDPSHPLAFLKNCSNQFRNAVLKRNTVSTMLELKRAFQDMGKEEKLLSFLEGKNLLSLNKHDHRNLMYSALSHLSASKSVDYVENRRRALGSSHMSSFHQHEMNYARQNSGRAHKDPFQHSVADSQNKVFCGSDPKIDRQRQAEQLIASYDTDDKMALSMAYRIQMKSEEDDILENDDSCFSLTQSHSSCQEGKETCMEKQPFPGGSLQAIKTEDRQSLMSVTDVLDTDSVNFTNVDPWGVCTDKDLGEIAEMMSDKGENKIHHSSSRKRKLTTPRKMIQ